MAKTWKDESKGNSMALLAQLGGATRQAVYDSGDPGKWLQTRLRRLLTQPTKAGQPWQTEVEDRTQALLAQAEQLEELAQHPKGRPMVIDVVGMAQLLCVDVPVGDPTLRGVLKAFCSKLLHAVVAPTGGFLRRLADVVKALDAALIPRWVHRGHGGMATVPKVFKQYAGNGWRSPSPSPMQSQGSDLDDILATVTNDTAPRAPKPRLYDLDDILDGMCLT